MVYLWTPYNNYLISTRNPKCFDHFPLYFVSAVDVTWGKMLCRSCIGITGNFLFKSQLTTLLWRFARCLQHNMTFCLRSCLTFCFLPVWDICILITIRCRGSYDTMAQLVMHQQIHFLQVLKSMPHTDYNDMSLHWQFASDSRVLRSSGAACDEVRSDDLQDKGVTVSSLQQGFVNSITAYAQVIDLSTRYLLSK